MFVKLVTSGVIVRKFYIEQMFVLVRMQFHNHVDRAYERGVREVHCTRARKVKGPEMMKVRGLRFSVIKPKLWSLYLFAALVVLTSLPSKILTNPKLKWKLAQDFGRFICVCCHLPLRCNNFSLLYYLIYVKWRWAEFMYSVSSIDSTR